MPWVDIVSIRCNDEQDWDGQDEIYVKLLGSRNTEISPTYRNIDSGDVIYPYVDPVYFIREDSAKIYLYEDDGSTGPNSAHPYDDDQIDRTLVVSYTNGQDRYQTVTLEGSGGEYVVTYEVWL